MRKLSIKKIEVKYTNHYEADMMNLLNIDYKIL